MDKCFVFLTIQFIYKMGKIMAIDYGEKRCGIAVTDDLKLIASGLTTTDTKEIFHFLAEYFDKHLVEELVIGIAPNHRNQLQAIEQEIQKFVKKFQKKYSSIPISRVDERFTSKMAFQSMIQAGLKQKKRRDKALVDKISATLILQSFLDQKSNL